MKFLSNWEIKFHDNYDIELYNKKFNNFIYLKTINGNSPYQDFVNIQQEFLKFDKQINELITHQQIIIKQDDKKQFFKELQYNQEQKLNSLQNSIDNQINQFEQQFPQVPLIDHYTINQLKKDFMEKQPHLHEGIFYDKFQNGLKFDLNINLMALALQQENDIVLRNYDISEEEISMISVALFNINDYEKLYEVSKIYNILKEIQLIEQSQKGCFICEQKNDDKYLGIKQMIMLYDPSFYNLRSKILSKTILNSISKQKDKKIFAIVHLDQLQNTIKILLETFKQQEIVSNNFYEYKRRNLIKEYEEQIYKQDEEILDIENIEKQQAIIKAINDPFNFSEENNYIQYQDNTWFQNLKMEDQNVVGGLGAKLDCGILYDILHEKDQEGFKKHLKLKVKHDQQIKENDNQKKEFFKKEFSKEKTKFKFKKKQ